MQIKPEIFTPPPAEDWETLVLPRPIESLPNDALTNLYSAGMQSMASAKMSDRPPLVFLDEPQNCATNSAAITRVADALFGQDPVRNTAIIIGAPGLMGFYLPEPLSGLSSLAARAATVAFHTGELGKSCVRLRLVRDYRPAFDSGFHEDDTITHLICSDKASTAFAMTQAVRKLNRDHIEFGNAPEFFSPLPGMPVAFNKIIHSPPFLQLRGLPDPRPKLTPSNVVVIESMPVAEACSSEFASSENIAEAINRVAGQMPYRWTPKAKLPYT